jgi:hypothetical protein
MAQTPAAPASFLTAVRVNDIGSGAVSGAIGGFVAGLPEGGVGAIPGRLRSWRGSYSGSIGGLAKQAGAQSDVVNTATIFYGSGRIVHDFTKSIGKVINDLP